MTNTVLKWLLLVLLTGYTAWVTVWANREARRHECTGITVNVLGSENPNILERTRSGIETELARYPEQITGIPVHNVNTERLKDIFLHSPISRVCTA